MSKIEKKTRGPIVMEEGYWANSQFSIARYYGGIKFNGETYLIVNKHGITLEQLSDPDGKYYVGNDKRAIEAGEPADLCLVEWIPLYKKLGRERFLNLIRRTGDLKEAKLMVKEGKI